MGDPSLNFSRAAPRHLVHRQSIAEVFVTEVLRSGPDSFVAGVQWPRRHAVFSAPMTRLDSHLVAETIRQLTIVLCHLEYGVPLGARFLMPSLGLTIEPGAETEFSNASPANCTVFLHGEGIERKRSGELRSIRVRTDFQRNGQVVGRGHGDATLATEGVYRRLRGTAIDNMSPAWPRRELDVLPPRLVGHLSTSDVVLSAGTVKNKWPLTVDTSNTVYFDHPLDHIPGILAVEAMRQAIRVASMMPEAELAFFEATFLHVLEFDSLAVVQLTESDDLFHMKIVQFGRTAVHAVAGLHAARVSVSGRLGPAVSVLRTGNPWPQSRAGESPTSLEPAATGHRAQ